MKIRLFVATLVVCLGAATTHANNISTATGPFTPSFRGAANTTYFGWTNGSWDGNADAAAGEPAIPDVINGLPPINPGSLAGPLLVQNTASDIVSSSNNVYTGPANINLKLTVPTAGTPGTGFTTIIAQGTSLGGFGGLLDVFAFGDINGVAPTYVHGINNDGDETQFWAKWELPGNSAAYDVSVIGSTFGGNGVASMAEMRVDSVWSPNGYAADFATAVPEPTSFALVGAALTAATAMVRRRR